MAKPFRIAAFIAAGLLLLILCVFAALHIPAARRQALMQAVRVLERQGILLEAAGLDYNLATLTLHLQEATLRSKAAPDLPPIAKISAARIDLHLRDLIAGKLHVEDAVVTRPELYLVIDERGRDNLPRPPESKDDTQTDWLVRKLRLAGGSLRVDDRRQKINLSLPSWRLQIDGDPRRQVHEIQLASESRGELLFERRRLPIEAVNARLDLGRNDANLRNFDVRLGESRIALAGYLRDFRDPRFDLKFNTALELASAVEFAGIPQPIRGTLNLTFAASGPLGQLEVIADASSRNLSFENIDGIQLAAHAAYARTRQRVEISSIEISAPEGRLSGKGSLALTEQAGMSTLDAKALSLQLEPLARAAKLPLRLASRASGSVEARWPSLLWEKASGQGRFQLTATRRQAARDILPVSGLLAVRGTPANLTADLRGVQTLGTQANGQVRLAGKGIAGIIGLESPDIGATLSEVERFAGRELTDASVSGSAIVEARLNGTIQSPRIAARIQAPSLSSGEIKNAALEASIVYTPLLLEIENSSLTWQGQSVRAHGTVGLDRKQALALTAEVERASIRDLLVAAGRTDVPAAGQISGTAKITGTSTVPDIEARVSVAGLTAYSELFGNLDANIRMQGDAIAVQRLRLDQPGAGSLQAAGTYDLETKIFQGDIQADNLALRTFTLPDGTPVRGRFDIKAAGSGTAQDPRLTAEIRAEDLAIRGQQIGAASADLKAEAKQAEVLASVPKYNLTAKATGRIEEPYPLQFDLRADKLDLAALPIQMKEPVTGTVTAAITGSGNARDWQKGQAEAKIDQLDLRFRNEPIESEGPILAGFRDGVLTVRQATLRAVNSRVSLAGSLPLEGNATGEIRIQGTADLARAAKLAPTESPVAAQGEASVNLTLRGNLQSIDPSGEIAIRNGSFDAPGMKLPVNDVQLAASIANGILTLASLSAVWGPANLNASGTVPFGVLGESLPIALPRGSGPAKFEAEVKELAIAALPDVPERLTGDVSIRIEGSAARPDLRALEATVSFPQLALRFDRIRLAQPSPSRIRIANGTARIEQLELTGPATKLQFFGSASLMEPRTADLKLTGAADAGLLAAFTNEMRAAGPIQLELTAVGPLEKPEIKGFLELAGGQLRLPNPQIDADDLNLRIELAGDRAAITRLNGAVNGGTLDGSGSARYVNGEVRDATADLTLRGVYLDFPDDLRTISNADLTLREQNNRMVLGGQVNVVEGSFNDDLSLDEGVLAFLERQPDLGLTEDRNPALDRLSFNIGVNSAAPVVIDNNLAKAELNLALRVVGTYYRPSIVGRVTLEEGGEIYLQERDYLVDRGVITFTDERRISPSLDILARTRAAGYDITLQVQGDPGSNKKTETILTSDPPLPEPDILAVLLTGRTLEEIRGQEVDIARDQVLSYLTGRAGGAIGRQLQQATGLSTVRVEPELIANESDPTARLTVGQNITHDLNLIYSMNLRNSQDQIWVAEYDLTRRFQTRGVRQPDNTYRLEFRHDVSFGGLPEPPRLAQRERRIVGNVAFSGNRHISSETLAKRFRVKSGKPYDFFKVRKGLERMQETYREAELLESRIRLQRDVQGQSVNLTVNVNPGPKVEFVFEGIQPSGGLRERIAKIWHDGVFDLQRAEDSAMEIRKELVEDRFLRPQIEHRINEGDPKRVLFDVQRGARYSGVKLVFEGASGIKPGDLEEVIEDQKLETAVYVNPEEVTATLTRFYQEKGFLGVNIKAPRYELDATSATGRVVFPIAEGPPYQVAAIRLQGNTVLDEAELLKDLPLQTGKAYRPELRERSAGMIQDRYSAAAYNDALIEHRIRKTAQDGLIEVEFEIAEGQQTVIRNIEVTGHDETSERMVRAQLAVKPGELLVLDKVSESRRNLYTTGAYTFVDMEREPAAGAANLQVNQRAVDLKVKLREIQPYSLRYGAYYDTERGPGGIFDVANRNSLGSARVIGLRGRYDADFRDGRIYFSQPTLLRFPVKTIGTAFVTREIRDLFLIDRKGVSGQQEARFRNVYVFNYGYRLENVKSTDREPDPILGPLPPLQYRIAPLTSTLTRETRDDLLDASRGSFTSHAIEYAPSLVGSEIRYMKYFGQFFKYFPLSEPSEVPWLRGLRKTRLVYAAGIRYGAGRGLGGQTLLSTERFFAGGGTTVRGFAQDELGPKGARGLALGGDSVLILNNEIRFPLIYAFDGVGFFDAGNVYRRASDVSFSDVRKAAGIGLRARTPWFLLRLDYGVKLDRQPGESRGRIFFSIGQAF